MEHKIEVLTTQPSLLMLYNYCHLEIFEFLELDDSINLAGTCTCLRYVANRIFKKYSSFHLFSSMLNKGEEYIDLVFSYIGQHVSSLKLNCFEVQMSISKIFGTISKECKNLNCLNIYNWKHDAFENVPSVYSFEHVELLTLYNCNFNYIVNFLKSFHKLKSLNIDDCIIEQKILKTVFQNNPSIKSFVYEACDVESDFNFKLIELIPNIETVSLVTDNSFRKFLELSSLLKLNCLTKLRLRCQCKNINKFLIELAKKENLEEMHLEIVGTDDQFFDILTSFDKLQLLVIDSSSFSKLKSSTALPIKLKRLRLEWLELTYNDFITMIEQLKSIESIDVHDCFIGNDDESYFNDAEKLSQQILYIIEQSNRKQRLDVILPYRVKTAGNDPPKQYLVDLKRLRIKNNSYEYDPLRINIHFPGFDSL